MKAISTKIKLFLCCFLWLGFLVPGYAQKYHPFPVANATWAESDAGSCGGWPSYSYAWNYKIRADTTINGRTWHLVKYRSQSNCQSYPYNYEISTQACIREDSSRHVYVCCYGNKDTTSHLLYDFNLKIGDTLKPTFIHNRSDTVIVYGIDSLKVGTTYHKQYLIQKNFRGGRIIQSAITEGIGNSYGLFTPFNDYDYGNYSALDCYCENGDTAHLSSRGCTFYGPITPGPPPVILGTVHKSYICSGQCVYLGGTAYGGTPPYTWTRSMNGVPITATYICLTAPATFTIVATDATGSASAPYIDTILIYPPIQAVIRYQQTLCQGKAEILKVQPGGGDGNYSYSWFPSTGLTSTTQQQTSAQPTSDMTYTVVITDGCGSKADTVLIALSVSVCAGIQEWSALEESLQLYPNPFTGALTLAFDTEPSGCSFRLFDVTGREVLSRRLTAPKTQLDLSWLSPGIYFLEMSKGKERLTRKIVKQ